MQRSGHQTMLSADGPDGLAKALADPPDLAVIDVMMPDMTGYEVVRQLRANSATASLPIIILTARGQPVDRQAALDAGADMYMSKPVTMAELSERVEGLLAKRTSARGSLLKGTLVILPLVNTEGFHARRPYSNQLDHLNQNKVFPGDPEGSMTRRVAHAVFDPRLAEPHELLVVNIQGPKDLEQHQAPFDLSRLQLDESLGLFCSPLEFAVGDQYGCLDGQGVDVIVLELQDALDDIQSLDPESELPVERKQPIERLTVLGVESQGGVIEGGSRKEMAIVDLKDS